MRNLKVIAIEILKRTYGDNLKLSEVKKVLKSIDNQPTLYAAEEVVLNLTR